MPVTVAVALGGALGAAARYGVDRLIERRTLSVFPWSTFTINVTGCFAAGLAVAALAERHHAPAALRAGVIVGFLGAYTTFSTFAQETFDLGRGGDAALAVVNAAASVGVGLVAVWAGSRLGRVL
jgi:CrcB protein